MKPHYIFYLRSDCINVAGDRPNLFVKWRVRYIEVLFHTFYCNFGRDIEIISFVISRTSLNRGSLNRGSTVLQMVIRTLTFVDEHLKCDNSTKAIRCTVHDTVKGDSNF